MRRRIRIQSPPCRNQTTTGACAQLGSLVGRWDRALPELRALPREEARRIFERANRWAIRDPRVRRPAIAVWGAWTLLWLAYLTRPCFGFDTSSATTIRFFVAPLLLFLVAKWLERCLTLSPTRRHIRLEIGTLCPDCGYDLRGGQLDWRTGLADPKTGRFNCPECGAGLWRVYVEEGVEQEG